MVASISAENENAVQNDSSKLADGVNADHARIKQSLSCTYDLAQDGWYVSN